MIQVGQVFLNKFGHRALITGKASSPHFAFEGLVTRPDRSQYKEIYLEDGRLSKDVPCNGDLIMANLITKPEFEVGKTYKNRQGDSVKIVDEGKGQSYPLTGEVNGFPSSKMSFTIHGEYLEGSTDQRDLVHPTAEVDTYTRAQIESALQRHGASPTEFFAIMDAEKQEYLRLKAIYGDSE